MKITTKMKLGTISALLVSGLFMSGSALAIGGGGSGGDCSVSTERALGAQFLSLAVVMVTTTSWGGATGPVAL